MELSQNMRAARMRQVDLAHVPIDTPAGWLETRTVSLVLLPLSCLLWFVSLQHIDMSRVSDLGLISVLPPLLFIATGTLTVSFALLLRRNAFSTTLVLLHLAVLVFMLYGITPLVEHGVTRFAATYKHVGIVDYIVHTGHVDPRIDAYFNWPAFFIFSAFVQRVCGLQNILPVVLWAPVAFNLMYLAPLAAIARSATGDRRLVWLAVWLFFMMNWVGQDYYSPQGLTYFLYLTTLAIVLTWFRATSHWPSAIHRMLGVAPASGGYPGTVRTWLAGWAAPPDAPSAHATPVQRFGLMVMLVVILLTTVASHQLTPFAALATLTALAVFNRSSLRSIPVLIFAAAVTWIVFMANIYLAGHLHQMTGHVFRVGSTINQNVGSRLDGSAQHVFVVHATMLTTAGIFGLVALGAIRSIRHGYRDLTYGLLVIAPFGLLLLQSYEGEGLLRVYLYALPGIVFFAAALFYTKPDLGRSWRATIAIVILSQVLIGAFYLSRYGNERMDYFPPAELAAVNHLYDIAPRGSVLMAGSDNLPWRFRGYNAYTYAPANDSTEPTSAPLMKGNVRAAVHLIASILSDPRYRGGYIIFTSSERAYAEMFGVYPRGTYGRLERAIGRSHAFQRLYRNADAEIFSLAGMSHGQAPGNRGTG